jgi:hypothetical protein
MTLFADDCEDMRVKDFNLLEEVSVFIQFCTYRLHYSMRR